uniref:cysteine/serine-rich nuclear protein 1 n=1 Tax=Jaculus jaculus TaxID=51337 RepID=UPI000332F0BD|nr:cysteine/serine-rich nuclear protein 1 [Jaculus jaculus]
MTGLLKRKFDQLEEDFCSSSSSSSSCLSCSCSPSSSASLAWDSDEEKPWGQATQPDHNLSGLQNFTPLSILKRAPRERPGHVAFGGITVYYFPRCQGFTSVPSRGGCTLGMAPRHSASRLFSLAEFSQEQAWARREKLRQVLKEEKLEKLSSAGASEAEAGLPLTANAIDDASVEEDLAVAVARGRLEEVNFLQPYPPRKRRALLRASGVRRIDREEKRQLQALRQSRQDCGCRCDGVCDPDTCSCSLAGIKCQMDHTTFPCGCCREGCENPSGRVEFNQARVQTHFIHTLTRLQLEQGAESLGELEAPAQGAPPSPVEQTLVSAFPLVKSPGSSESGDNSCSSDMTTESSSSSGSHEAPHHPACASLPGPGCQPGVDDNSLAQILSLSDSDLGGEEDDEEGQGVGNLDNLSCFQLADIFAPGDLGGLTSRTLSQSGCSLVPGILDENANLDASCFLNGGLEGLKEGNLPGTSVSPGVDAGQSISLDLSLSSCDSFELLQALPDYSLGPHYSSYKAPNNLEALHGPLASLSPPRDASTCFLESLIGLPEPATEVLAPLLDSQFEDATLPPLMEPVSV